MKRFVFANQMKVSLNLKAKIHPQLSAVHLSIKDTKSVIHIMDEYDDLSEKHPLIPCLLVLREFELLDESSDYMNWCKKQGLEIMNEAIRSYYQGIIPKLEEIRACFPGRRLTSFITDLDFQLNAGAMQVLRAGREKL